MYLQRLTKGMYGHEFQPLSPLFGLRCGQMRGGDQKWCHNAGWYNSNGEKLGWGDLSRRDIGNMMEGLFLGEVVIVLSEEDSFWNFVREARDFGWNANVEPDVEAPGKAYVMAKAVYLVTRGQIFYVDRFRGCDKKKVIERDGLLMQVVKPQEVEAVLKILVS